MTTKATDGKLLKFDGKGCRLTTKAKDLNGKLEKMGIIAVSE